MATVKGDLRILYIKVSDTYVPIGCLTGNSYSESSETLGTTTRDNAGWTTFRPTNQTFGIEFAGVYDDTVSLGYDELKEYKRNRTLLDWKIQTTGDTYYEYGRGYLTDISESADAGDIMVFSGTLQGYGRPLKYDPNNDNAPTAPVLNPTVYTSGNDYLDLTWSAATDDYFVAGYEVRIGTSSGWPYEIIDVGDVLTYQDTGLIEGQTYRYNVRAYDSLGQYSDWSNLQARGIVSITGFTDGILFQDGIGQIFQDREASYFQ